MIKWNFGVFWVALLVPIKTRKDLKPPEINWNQLKQTETAQKWMKPPENTQELAENTWNHP